MESSIPVVLSLIPTGKKMGGKLFMGIFLRCPPFVLVNGGLGQEVMGDLVGFWCWF